MKSRDELASEAQLHMQNLALLWTYEAMNIKSLEDDDDRKKTDKKEERERRTSDHTSDR